MERRMKYVRLENNVIIFFPEVIQHKEFKGQNPISAGFCYFFPDKVSCFGESISLNKKSNPEQDSFLATKQIWGFDVANKLLK